MNTWTVLDTETTGFSHHQDRLVEFAAARFDPQNGDLLKDRLHLLINPKISISAEISRIHGITDERIKDSPSFSEIADQILGFVADSILVIQNASFDMRFLNAELERANKTTLDKVIARVICTRKMSNLVMPGKPASLDKLCDLFKVDRSKRTQHGALIDCELLAKVYPHLARMAADLDAKVEALIPFPKEQDLPDDIRELGNAYLALETVIKLLEKEQKRIEAQVKKLTEGNNFEDRDFVVEFTGSGITTDYKRAVLENCPNLDISAYQKPAQKRLSIKPV